MANVVTVQVIEYPSNIVVQEEEIDIIIGETGPQGPSGQADPADLGYVHIQNTPSTTWTISHGLGFIPNITVVDSGGTVVEGSYNYPNANTVVLSFSSAFSGKAYLS
jgi:hypothetical protein